ncbi:conjugal transfer protein TrbE [Chitinimonas arctica]|uniref:Conjugal transfer protein TrbE n=1 Tax=Chitinimonas arctica TaxID=2594795 RepID=A0A516SHD6_9NEIS|nr:conjugal transfer protein TrbE [Chitinimonas arctica]QDQ27569.1 conjugal transfer protein TrbE [Chitinimonas arctica]
MLKLKQFRDRSQSLADLLNFALMPEDGILQNKDGSLMVAWYFRGEDMDSATHAELASISSRLNNVLVALGSGWMLNCDAIRRPATVYPGTGSFTDRTSWLIDEERRSQYEAEGSHFETTYAMTLSFLPSLRTANKLIDLIYDDDQRDTSDTGFARRIIEQFKRQVDDFESVLNATFPMRRMRGVTRQDVTGASFIDDEFLQYLEYCVSGERRPVRLPSIPMYLDALIGCHTFYGGIEPKVGERHIKVVAIDGFPHDSYPGILHVLDTLGYEYRWSTRFIFLDPHQARGVMNGVRRRWQQKQRGLKDQMFNTASGAVDLDAVEMSEDVQAAIGEAESNMVKFGYYTSCVVLMHENRELLTEQAREVRKAILNHGFGARIEDINAVEAYLGSVPGHGYANVRRPILHTLNLADLLPITAVWAGLEHNPCPFYPEDSPPLSYAATTGFTPFRFSLHVGDVGHTLMVGKTGGGKSTALNFLLAQHMRYPNAQVFAFDKGYSSFILTKACGGTYYDIAGEDSDLAFCPLQQLDTAADQGWAAEWIEVMLTLQGVNVTPALRQSVYQAIMRLVRSPRRTLTEFVAELQDEELRQALSHYTLAGPMGSLLDAEEDCLGNGSFQVFEMEHLMNLGEKNVVPVLLYLFRQIEKRMDGRPTLVALDECWLMLSHNLFRDKVREWLKTWRKKNAVVFMATQELADVMNSPIRDVVLASCPTKILLPNPEAREPSSRGMYEVIGLNEREIELLAHATVKRHYYYKSPLGRRMFSFGFGPVALSFVGASGQEDIRTAKQLMQQYREDWPAAWLRSRGLDYWADVWQHTSETETETL